MLNVYDAILTAFKGALRPKRAIRWPRPGSSITSCAASAPVSSSSTSSTVVSRGRRRDVEAIFAALRRLGREYDISTALVGEAAVYDHIHLTDEMASRFTLAPVPRWRHGEDDLALPTVSKRPCRWPGLRAIRTRRSRARSSPCPKG